MGKQWARQEAKRDELAKAVGTAAFWATENRQKTLAAAGGGLGLLLLGGLILYRIHANRETAWEKLAIAQSAAYQGQLEPAMEQLQAIETRFAQTPASAFGALFTGDVLYRREKYKEAVEVYRRLADRRVPKAAVPFALSGLGLSQEAAGDCNGAMETSQRFLDAHQDHFLAPQVHASLARCLNSLGMREKARTAYERISLLYPESAWAKWAQERLKGG